MLERLKWPGLALIMGILGGVLVRWQRASAFDDAGLARPGAPASIALTACFILAEAVFLLLARGTVCASVGGTRLSRWDLTFAAGGDRVYPVLMTAGAFSTVLAVPLLLRETAELTALRSLTGEGENGVLQTILALAALAAALSMVTSGVRAVRMRGYGRENCALLLPVVMGCVWILEAYRANAPDPEGWHYVPLLLAIAAGVLFFLDCAGLSFETGHARRMLWFAAMTVVTSAAALCTAPGKTMMALLAGQLLAALAALWIAPGNLAHPPAEERFGLRARMRQEQSPDTNDEIEGAEPDSDPQEIQEEDTNV